MKNDHALITDVDTLMTSMLFTQVLNPLQVEYYATIIRKILKNKKGYDYDEKNILMLIKRLYSLGYTVTANQVYLYPDLTQQEIDSIPQMTDNDILVFCQDKFNN